VAPGGGADQRAHLQPEETGTVEREPERPPAERGIVLLGAAQELEGTQAGGAQLDDAVSTFVGPEQPEQTPEPEVQPPPQREPDIVAAPEVADLAVGDPTLSAYENALGIFRQELDRYEGVRAEFDEGTGSCNPLNLALRAVRESFQRVERRYQAADELRIDLENLANIASGLSGSSRWSAGIASVGDSTVASSLDPSRASRDLRAPVPERSTHGDTGAELTPPVPQDLESCDVFINCASVDDQPALPGKPGWVSQLQRNLGVRMEQLSGRPASNRA